MMNELGSTGNAGEVGQIEHLAGLDTGKRSYTLLQGHAGPVYAANLSPEGDFILSASEDCTGIHYKNGLFLLSSYLE